MTIVILWFVLSGGTGFIEPLNITPEACGRATNIPRLEPDREVNPRAARWADCEVDIRAKVATLTPGVYHLAATGLGSYIPPDPHTSGPFVVSRDFEEQTTARPVDRYVWSMEGASLATVQGYRFEVEVDGAVTVAAHGCAGPSSPFECSAPIGALTPGEHTARVRAVDVTIPEAPNPGPFSEPVTFTMRAVPSKPGVLRIQPGSGD